LQNSEQTIVKQLAIKGDNTINQQTTVLVAMTNITPEQWLMLIAPRNIALPAKFMLPAFSISCAEL